MGKKIKLNGDTGRSSWQDLNPGYEQLLRIKKANYDDRSGKVMFIFEDIEDATGTNTLNIGKTNSRPDIAQKVLSIIAKCAMDDFTLDEIDVDDLVGRYVVVDVDIEERDGRKYFRYRNFKSAEGDTFETVKDAAGDDADDTDINDIFG